MYKNINVKFLLRLLQLEEIGLVKHSSLLSGNTY